MFKIGDKFYNTKTKGYGVIVNVTPYEMPIRDDGTGTEYLHITKAYQMINIFNKSSTSWLLEDTINYYIKTQNLELINDFKPLKVINKFVF